MQNAQELVRRETLEEEATPATNEACCCPACRPC